MRSTTTRRAFSLTERDHELLVSLLKYRYLSTTQIQRLHFPSTQTATRRLRLLSAASYVTTFRAPATTDRLATLSRLGAEAVAERLAVPFAEIGWDGRRQRPKDYLFLRHFIAASDFRITLTLACADRADVRLLGFLPEHLVERTPKGAVQKYVRDVIADVSDHRQKLTHAPDGVFALQRAGASALFFLEVDRGTETLSNPDRGVLKMVRFYLSSLVGGAYQRYGSDFGAVAPFRAFRVLVVTSSHERLENIRSLAGRAPFEPAHAKRFVWLATDEALHDGNILTRRWASLDPQDSQTYAILAE